MADKPVDPAKGNALLQKLLKTKTLPMTPDPTAIPLGLERDPIAQQLSKMGRPVTRGAWLTLDRGSSDESELDEETKAMLDRMFPQEDCAMDNPNRPETEEDGIRAGALRRAQVRHLMRGRQTPDDKDR